MTVCKNPSPLLCAGLGLAPSKFMPNTIVEHTFKLWKDCIQLGKLYIEMKT